MRVGLGYDIHRFKAGRKLILGGVEIPHSHGLEGHSDADSLTHAVCDALLGAMGAGDLGGFFPSDNEQFKDMSSLVMLQDVQQLLAQKGYRLVNLDTIIHAETPRLRTYVASIQKQLAVTLHVPVDLINVKIKSGDKIGMIGRKEGIGAQAICLIAFQGT